MSLGRNIRAVRDRLGWTLDDLSARSDVGRAVISALENRDSKKSEHAPALARALGVPLAQLLGDTTPPEQPARLDATGTQLVAPGPDDIVIPQFATGGRMGNGGLVLRDQPGVIHQWLVSQEWLAKNVRASHSRHLAIVTGFGDSMRPMFNPGDPLLLDRSVTTVEFDAIYFFRVGDEGFIKRLQRVPGQGLIAISENTKYVSWTITADMDFEVFGRVLKVWRGDDY